MVAFHRIVKHVIAWSVFTALACWGGETHAIDETKKQTEDRKGDMTRYGNADVGRDPHQYESGQYILQTDAQGGEDARVVALVRQITCELQSGASLEGRPVWSALNELAPWCESKEVQGAVSEWAALSARQICQSAASGSAAGFDEANADYKAGEFLLASQKYRQLLRETPAHLDCRNNLALARIRLGDDLIALLELKVLLQIEPQYLPAWVNLTVVYERLGNRARAREATRQAIQLQPTLSQAVFNAAWYENVEGNFAKADELLAPIQEWDAGPKYRGLYELNKRNMARTASAASGEPSLASSGFWQRGLAGVWGGRSGWASWILAVSLFAVSTAVAIRISVGMSRNNRDAAVAAFWLFVVLGGLWCVVYWGVPSDWWWGVVVVYLLVCGALSSVAAKQ